MLNIYSSFKEIFSSALTQIAAERSILVTAKDFENFTVEPTKEKSHGDLACNAAMVLSKKFVMNPRELAQELINKLAPFEKGEGATSSEVAEGNLNPPSSLRFDTSFFKGGIHKLEIAGPGFINISLKPQIFYRLIEQLLREEKFQFPNLGRGEKINLEYASPNPTGPIHVGHTRGAIYGDVLATLLLKTGYDVLKEYYINDAGAQINNLVKSAYVRYREACGQKVEIGEGLYPGEYLIPIGFALKEKFGDLKKGSDPFSNETNIGADSSSKGSDPFLEEVREFVVSEMIELIKRDLLALGIKHDSYFSEKKESA